MLVAVLSDIHANLEALQAVLDDMDAHGAEGILGLGDYIGFNGNPAECLALVRPRLLAAVQGNLPDGMLMDSEKRIVSWELSDGLRTLSCAVEVLPQGGTERLRWREHRLTAVTEDVWN